MKLTIGGTIKELRQRDNRKQDDLARALGVSAQAVSRWEANRGYPDTEIIPSIAKYFHVTIDELFGYNGERETKINEFVRVADQALRTHQGLDECVKTLRNASEEFPSEPKILLRLGFLLMEVCAIKEGIKIKNIGAGDYTEYNTEANLKNETVKEALAVFEKAVHMNITPDEQKPRMNLICKFSAERSRPKCMKATEPSNTLVYLM